MRLVPLLLAIVMATPVAAQHAHSDTGHEMGGPQETGQSAFAALAEIVAILQADPETDWERADIAGIAPPPRRYGSSDHGRRYHPHAAP